MSGRESLTRNAFLLVDHAIVVRMVEEYNGVGVRSLECEEDAFDASSSETRN